MIALPLAPLGVFENKSSSCYVLKHITGKIGYFSNTPVGAKSSAVIYSIVRTALANGLRVEAYLRWLFVTVPKIDIKVEVELDALMPWSPAVPEDCRMNPAEQEAAEAEINKD